MIPSHGIILLITNAYFEQHGKSDRLPIQACHYKQLDCLYLVGVPSLPCRRCWGFLVDSAHRHQTDAAAAEQCVSHGWGGAESAGPRLKASGSSVHACEAAAGLLELGLLSCVSGEVRQ